MKESKKIKKEEKGITLIALVVTIIVLLILAGVAISLSIGENGIFKRAEEAVRAWKNAENNESLAMDEAANFIGGGNEENKPDITEEVYAILYKEDETNYTLAFNRTGKKKDGKEVILESGNIGNTEFNESQLPTWYNYAEGITRIDIEEEIKPKYTSAWFAGCTRLKNIDTTNLITSNVTNMEYMFTSCNSLTELNVSGFDTSNVTNMYGMFASCYSLTELDLSRFDTSNVTNMHGMFFYCRSLTELNLSGFDTSNVTNMGHMFERCHSLTKLDISRFDTSKVTNMEYMFANCNSLTELDVSGFNTSNVINMYEMFAGCSSLVTIQVRDKWTVGNVKSSSFMFDNCTKLVGAVPYDEAKTDASMANYETGYLTLKK